MTSSPGLPLPPSQGSPTAAIWFIWKFYQCFPSPSSRIQTTWVWSIICLISQVLPISPSWPCWTLSTTSSAASPSPSARRPSLFSPLRLRSPGWRRSWWPSLCHSHLLSLLPRSSVFWCWLSALPLRRRSSPRNLLLWQLSQRCRRKSLRVSRSPKTISKTRKRWRVMLKAWRTQVEEATSLEKVLSSFEQNTCLALFDKWMSEILRNMCTLRASWHAGVFIQTSLIRWPESEMSCARCTYLCT